MHKMTSGANVAKFAPAGKKRADFVQGFQAKTGRKEVRRGASGRELHRFAARHRFDQYLCNMTHI
jgi:hypothetical protein